MSKGTIELSPKHGVNATIPVCFWCGKEKNEIAILGRVRKRDPRTGKAVKGSDIEVPPTGMVLDYEPCDCCREKFEQGVQLIEISTSRPDGRPAITKDGVTPLYPTGAHIVIKSEAAKRTFNVEDETMLDEGKKLCLDQQTFKAIVSMAEKSQQSNI